MTTKEWNQMIAVIKYQNAYFANYHINKKIPVTQETETVYLQESFTDKGHFVWIPF